MGQYLEKPITEKNEEYGSSYLCDWGLCAMQGWRVKMEDSHISQEIDLPGGKSKGMLFCVFDGHGGSKVSEFASKNFVKTFINQKDFKNKKYSKALKQTFFDLDD